MRTKLSADNPHGHNRYGFAWHHIPQGGAAHLDFGCYDGVFLATLKSKGVTRLVGVDISADAVRQAHERFADIEVIRISKTVSLPFGKGAFTSITILDVIEHVDEQLALLDELNRVLQDNGILVVTVPGRHLFSFLDAGNLKFRFPRVHRWYYRRKHTEAQYEYRYVSNPDGLVGDISVKKRWHQHFSAAQLKTLLDDSGFNVVEFDGTGFFIRAIKNVEFLLGPVLSRVEGWFKPLQSFFRKLEVLDARLFESANLFCVARKRPRT
jgi:SAM-dependent methyltransferase